MAKSKKLKSTKYKKSDLLKANFAKVNSSGMDFLTFKAKKAFIHLQKTFIKALILGYYNSKYYIQIETDTSKYAIGGVLSQITLD